MRRHMWPVMVTVDRSPSPNYLAETIENLKRSIPADQMWRLILCDSGISEWSRQTAEGSDGLVVDIRIPEERMCANLNVASALRAGALEGSSEWVLFLEDDIDVCDNFFDSVGRWLDCHGYRSPVSIFGSVVANTTHEISQIELDKFYGTQAFAIRSKDAISLSEYLTDHCYDISEDGTNYDLLIARWVRETYPDTTHLSVSCPSFVQHIGRSSIINPRPVTHTFPSFPGRAWSYHP